MNTTSHICKNNPFGKIKAALGIVFCILGLTSCGTKQDLVDTPVSAGSDLAKETTALTETPRPKDCPAYGKSDGFFNAITDQHKTAQYWVNQWAKKEDVHQALLTAAQIDKHNRAVGKRGYGTISHWDLRAPVNTTFFLNHLKSRLRTLLEHIQTGRYVGAEGQPVALPLLDAFSIEQGQLTLTGTPDLFVATEFIQLYCAPLDGPLYNSDSDLAYDRNACSGIHPQEVVQVLGSWGNGMSFVRTSYTFGWIGVDAPLSKSIPSRYINQFVTSEKYVLQSPEPFQTPSGPLTLPRFTRVAMSNESGNGLIATPSEFVKVSMPINASATRRSFTRAAVLAEAFSYLDVPYGWGGSNQGRDCSRFLMDLFAAFSLVLPRNSSWQSAAGSYAVDLSLVEDDEQKMAYIDSVAQRGMVALYFPGHIMLYLGRDENNIPMVIHSLGEFAKPCQNSDLETVFRTKKVLVSDLTLGENSSRESLIKRITKAVVFGAKPPKSLAQAVSYRPPMPPIFPVDQCEDSLQQRIFISPRRPKVGEPVRIIATGELSYDPAQLQLWDGEGNRVPSTTQRLGGPPFTYWTKVTPQRDGRWTVVLGDGESHFACDSFSVRQNYQPVEKELSAEDPFWQSRWKWEQDTENLYSAFVEQLFNFPKDEDHSWTSLDALLKDADHNLLYNHLGLNEDEQLNLTPDCADLPYVLRAYFAWKTKSPFAVRSCSRGKPNRPPSCGEIKTNHTPIGDIDPDISNEIEAFQKFASILISWNAHSASARTHPRRDNTDFYPVALTKEALVPGTVFADPYGHVLIVTKWYHQQPGQYGVLMAADGQPDDTIGRRRFWQGSFLFDPATHSFGAGFKRFRPIVQKRTTDPEAETAFTLEPLKNRELRRSSVFSPFSEMQYQGSKELFYDTMQKLMNPQPLNPIKLLISRLDALEESVKRRVMAVDNGEKYMADHQYKIVEMPQGYDIFETAGPWEDYSTPSRDMRLLISFDAVTSLPEKVMSRPDQFGILKGQQANEMKQLLQARLKSELKQRSIQYTNSDGQKHELTLLKILNRLGKLEMAYNPNDCVEVRWGASPNSEEFASCNRRAPEEQQALMKQYQNWFATRTRPLRNK